LVFLDHLVSAAGFLFETKMQLPSPEKKDAEDADQEEGNDA
jgi:hypothetical protein